MKSDLLFNRDCYQPCCCHAVSPKMKLWHFIRIIENVSDVHNFTLGLAHELQQMQNGRKSCQLKVTEEINISVQKALTSECEVQRDSREVAECSIHFNKILQENIVKAIQKVAIECILIPQVESILGSIRTASQV